MATPTEQSINAKFAELAQAFHAETGNQLESVRFEWVRDQTIDKPRFLLHRTTVQIAGDIF